MKNKTFLLQLHSKLLFLIVELVVVDSLGRYRFPPRARRPEAGGRRRGIGPLPAPRLPSAGRPPCTRPQPS